MFITTFMAYLV